MIFEEETKVVESRGSSFTDCPNKCIDGYYIDPYQHKRIKCMHCAEQRELLVRKSITDKSGKTIEEMLNIPPAFSGINFESSSVLPKYALKNLEEDSVADVRTKLTELVNKISIGDLPNESILFNLGKKAFENNFICPFLLRAYNAGLSVVPMLSISELARLRVDYERGNDIEDISYKDVITRDVCVIVIDAGVTFNNIGTVKGLMQQRANKGLCTIIFTNYWGSYISDLCTEDEEHVLNLATLYSVKYINKDKEVEEKVKEQPKPISNSKSMVGISSEEFRNLMRG